MEKPVRVETTRLASNKIFSPSNKTHREVGQAKDLSARRYKICILPHPNTFLETHCALYKKNMFSVHCFFERM